MKPAPFEYNVVESVEAAVACKARYEDEAAVLAGGQSLVPMLNFRIARPRGIVDISRIPDLAYVFEDEDGFVVGAMTRQRDVELDAMVATRCPLLHQALGHVAHPTIRNRGTIGGTVAHGDAAGEVPTALVALGGHVHATGPTGGRDIPAEEFFTFHLSNALQPDEIVEWVSFPALDAGSGTAFLEVTRRHGDFALASTCLVSTQAEDGTLRDVAVAYGGIAPSPVRARDVEDLLRGEHPSDELLHHAGEVAAGHVDAIDEEQATVAYRQQLVRTLTRRAIRRATNQLGGET